MDDLIPPDHPSPVVPQFNQLPLGRSGLLLFNLTPAVGTVHLVAKPQLDAASVKHVLATKKCCFILLLKLLHTDGAGRLPLLTNLAHLGRVIIMRTSLQLFADFGGHFLSRDVAALPFVESMSG